MNVSINHKYLSCHFKLVKSNKPGFNVDIVHDHNLKKDILEFLYILLVNRHRGIHVHVDGEHIFLDKQTVCRFISQSEHSAAFINRTIFEIMSFVSKLASTKLEYADEPVFQRLNWIDTAKGKYNVDFSGDTFDKLAMSNIPIRILHEYGHIIGVQVCAEMSVGITENHFVDGCIKFSLNGSIHMMASGISYFNGNIYIANVNKALDIDADDKIHIKAHNANIDIDGIIANISFDVLTNCYVISLKEEKHDYN